MAPRLIYTPSSAKYVGSMQRAAHPLVGFHRWRNLQIVVSSGAGSEAGKLSRTNSVRWLHRLLDSIPVAMLGSLMAVSWPRPAGFGHPKGCHRPFPISTPVVYTSFSICTPPCPHTPFPTLLTLTPGINLSYSKVPNGTNQHTSKRRQHPLRTIAKQICCDSYVG